MTILIIDYATLGELKIPSNPRMTVGDFLKKLKDLVDVDEGEVWLFKRPFSDWFWMPSNKRLLMNPHYDAFLLIRYTQIDDTLKMKAWKYKHLDPIHPAEHHWFRVSLNVLLN